MKVLITGASSGIGRDMARTLAKDKNQLVLVARNEKALKAIQVELLDKYDVQAKIVAMDLGDYQNCVKLHSENKDIDLLINNAGFGDAGKFETTDLEKDMAMINTNIVALHTLTKLYLKDMKEKNSGHILNVASIAGFMPGPLMATYYATKAYVVRLSEAIREELRREKSRVKISILCPGPVNTNFEKNANVKFKVEGISSEYVAKYALTHLKKFYIIPTFTIKMARLGTKLISSKCASKFVYNIQSQRKQQNDWKNA